MNALRLVSAAAAYAAERHVGQRRKGAAAEPYLNHLAEVAALLAEAGDPPDAVLIAAGWLHDTVEDTGTRRDELEERFGPEVAALVAEVTDDKSLPKAERKQLQIVTAPKKSERAKLLKLADKTSNLRALAGSPPAHWEEARCLAYVDWAEEVVTSCRGLSASLDGAFDSAAADARAAVVTRRRA
jgi:(p)ppGpp synthase/HD superfamily hydrolase